MWWDALVTTPTHRPLVPDQVASARSANRRLSSPSGQLAKHRDHNQNPPPGLGYQSVCDTWGLAKVVRKIEFKLHTSSIIEIRYSFSPRPSSQLCSLVSHCTSSP